MYSLKRYGFLGINRPIPVKFVEGGRTFSVHFQISAAPRRSQAGPGKECRQIDGLFG